jgi:hypothetical protein
VAFHVEGLEADVTSGGVEFVRAQTELQPPLNVHTDE